METAIITVMLGAAAATIGYTMRSAWATYRTSHDKHKMLNLCKRQTLVYRYWNDLSISFHEHHAEYMMFRNPWRMYSSSFIDLAWRNGVIDSDTHTDAFHFARKREEAAKEERIQKFADDFLAGVPQSDTHNHHHMHPNQ